MEENVNNIDRTEAQAELIEQQADSNAALSRMVLKLTREANLLKKALRHKTREIEKLEYELSQKKLSLEDRKRDLAEAEETIQALKKDINDLLCHSMLGDIKRIDRFGRPLYDTEPFENY